MVTLGKHDTVSNHNHYSSRGIKHRNIAIVCLAILSIALLITLLFQTAFVQYHLTNLGLSDVYHKTNRSTVSSWNSCLEKLNIDADIVFFGDSITTRYDFQAEFPNKSIVNLGLSGDSILDMTQRVYMLKTVKPEKIFMMAGINSLKNEKMINKYYSQYVSLCNSIRESVPSAKLYILSVLPVSSSYDNRFLGTMRGVNNHFITNFNTMIRQYAEKTGLTYIDLHSVFEMNGSLNPEYSEDGVHITNESYSLWVDALKDYIGE